MSNPKDSREQPASKMAGEEAERLRELLSNSKPADVSESVLQRIGRVIGQAVYKPFKRDW